MDRDGAILAMVGGTDYVKTNYNRATVAVRNRPVEQFQTEAKLPDWQLEPDDEFMQGDPQDYYFIDENGNLVAPPGPEQPRGNAYPPDATEPERRPGSVPVAGPPTQAASDDFLQRATGGAVPRDGAPRRPAPTPTPRGYQPQQ
jgi:penicillin-binding protein 1A